MIDDYRNSVEYGPTNPDQLKTCTNCGNILQKPLEIQNKLCTKCQKELNRDQGVMPITIDIFRLFPIKKLFQNLRTNGRGIETVQFV